MNKTIITKLVIISIVFMGIGLLTQAQAFDLKKELKKATREANDGIKEGREDLDEEMKDDDEKDEASEDKEKEGEEDKGKDVKDESSDKDDEDDDSEGDNLKPKIIFSKSPIDPKNPENLTNSFKAGDHIYAVLNVEKAWKFLIKKRKDVKIMVLVEIDNKKSGNYYQYITLDNPRTWNEKYFVLDIAPAPDKMTAYKDDKVKWGAGKDGRKIGPDAFTHLLSQLEPGKHKIKMSVKNYGDVYTSGSFTIDGDDYSFYEELNEKVKQ